MKKILLFIFILLLSSNSFSSYYISYDRSYFEDSGSACSHWYGIYAVPDTHEGSEPIVNSDDVLCQSVRDSDDVVLATGIAIFFDDCSQFPNTVMVNNSCVIPVTCPPAGTIKPQQYCSPYGSDPSTNGINRSGNIWFDGDNCPFKIDDGDSSWNINIYDSEICITVNAKYGIDPLETIPVVLPPPNLTAQDPTTNTNTPKPIIDLSEGVLVTPPTTTTNANGDTVAVKQEISTTNKPTTITNTDKEYIRIDDSTIVKTTTTTTTTSPDGTVSVKQDTSYTNNSGNKIEVDKDTGEVKYTPPINSTTSNSVTTNYNSGGNVTSINSSGTQEGDDNNTDDMCDTADENCENFDEIIEEAPTVDDSQVSLDSLLADSKEAHEENLEEISELESWFENSGITTTLGSSFSSLVPSGSCSDYIIQGGAGYSLTLSCGDSAYIRDVLGYAMYVLLALFAFQTLVYPVRG